MINPKDEYLKRKNKYQQQAAEKVKKVNLISNLRLATFLIGAGTSIYFYRAESYQLSAIFLVVFAALFLFLILKHQQAIAERDYFRALVQINQTSLQRLAGEWQAFADKGGEFLDPEHPYALDLDIFGQGSLFQWINTTTSPMGREKLTRMLTEPCQTKESIMERQQAIQELAAKLNWRQELGAEGALIKEQVTNSNELVKWAMNKAPLLRKKWVIFGLRGLPALTVLLIILAFLSTSIQAFVPLLLIAVQIALLVPGYKERETQFAKAYKYKSSLQAYSGMIKLIEEEKFKTPLLAELQRRLQNNREHTASHQLKQLDKIMSAISHRFSQLYFLLNILFLWDYQCQIALERWKEKSGDSLEKWLETTGHIEALASLAIIRFDHPEWAMPEIVQGAEEPAKQPGKHLLTATSMGHPLLTGERVANDLEITPPIAVLLITGSNMSGKSTLLRTAGLNLVLAYLGVPVCAQKFSCTIMDIYTSMRVSDNLEKSISSFYAELLRIKKIVEAVEEGRPVFFLLDEIFKGTNSLDRHLGAKVLINKLSQEGALGLVSTHDLELGSLEQENKKIKNYHFREYYQDDRLKFDYRLRPGLSTTRNAKYLMQLAGIKLEEV